MTRDEQIARVTELVLSASLEISPRQAHEIEKSSAFIRPGMEISITSMPGDTDDVRVATALKLREAGFEPMPHLAARRITSRDAFAAFLHRLKNEAHVSNVLCVGGDVPVAEGPFNSSFEMISSGMLQEAGIKLAGITDYPEGHPAIDNPALEHAHNEKLAYAAANGLELFEVTQFCFEPGPIKSLIRKRRAKGQKLPIRIGVAGPASLKSLMKFAAMCGVGASMRFMQRNTGSVTKMLIDSGPEELIADLAADQEFRAASDIGMHVFVFGGFSKTAEWLSRFQAQPAEAIRKFTARSR